MGRERQRGAIGIMAAGTLLLALICLALVIDTGRLYYEQRKLQRVADMSALEAASQSGMCAAPASGSSPQDYALASAAKNGFVPVANGDLVATLGSISFDDTYGEESRRIFTPGGDDQDSVKVSVGRTVPSSLILNVASLFSGAKAQTRLSAEAVARRTAMAGISAGTTLASLDDQQAGLLNNLLNALLGSHLSLNAVGYRGLANANVSLLGLSDQMRALGVNVQAGSVDSLLGAQASLAQLLGATLNAIDPTQVTDLNTALLGQQLLGAGVKTATVTLGSVLSVVAPDSVRDQALQGSVNALDLISALAFVANRQHAVTLNTGVNLGGLTSAQVQLWIVEPPQIAFGYPGKDSNGQWRTQVRTAAIRTNVTGSVTLPGVLSIDLGLALDVAQGTAALESIACGGLGRPVDVTVHAQPGIAQLHLGTFRDGQSATVDPISVKIVGGLVGADVSAATVVGGVTGTSLDYRVSSPADLPSEPQTAASDISQSLDNAIGTLSSSINVTPTGILGLLSVLGLNPSSLVSTILGALRPALTALADVVLDPLLQLLGISLGTIDVRLIDLQTSGTELLI
ncbi:pilus assembly protein TadG-related protein [Pseudomonas sp. NY15181]|uniref:pilus assembly protein TadG-related protein n=1 Tax=Pseudomonas sp. NY15181 TaxID=3400349 RepID=UPI003A8502EE